MDEFNRDLNEEPENTEAPKSQDFSETIRETPEAESANTEPMACEQNNTQPETDGALFHGEAPAFSQPEPQRPDDAFVPPFGNAAEEPTVIPPRPQPAEHVQYQPQPQPQPRPEPEPQPQFRPPYRPQPAEHAQYQPAHQPVFNGSGEYRYVPPKNENPQNVQGFGGYNGAADGYGQTHAPYQPAGTAEPAPKKKKEKKTFSAGAVALIIVACILLSLGAGIGGALLVTKNGAQVNESNALVIYKTAEEDDDENSPTVPEDEMSVKGVCAKVASSVVEIETEFKNSYGFYQYVSAGAGSGVIISKDGYLITNNHVIFNSSTNAVADNVTVRLNNGTEYKAKIVGRDTDADIALLKVEAKDLTPAVIGDSSKVEVGETVIAVGNPLGELGGTVTCGIISATNREISVENNRMNLIQIDAAVNPGNSGGGMFNMKGELVGIVNSGVTGSDVDGLGFGIPINDATAVIEELQTHGYVTGKSYLGISAVDVTDVFTAYRYFNSQQTGVYIAQVQEGYNDKVLQYGDRIIAIDGEEVVSSEDIREALKSHKVGDTMTFSISREGKFVDVTVTCYEYVPDADVTFSEN